MILTPCRVIRIVYKLSTVEGSGLSAMMKITHFEHRAHQGEGRHGRINTVGVGHHGEDGKSLRPCGLLPLMHMSVRWGFVSGMSGNFPLTWEIKTSSEAVYAVCEVECSRELSYNSNNDVRGLMHRHSAIRIGSRMIIRLGCMA